jgi:F420-dependent oxidoreductase-like protein
MMIEGQEDVGWDEWLALAGACESAGIEGLFTSDHYFSVFERDERGSFDAWTVLAALAARTSRLRLGTMVSPVTFRHPAAVAKAAVTIDHVSGGRVAVGLGAGWWEREHVAYGFPFPPLGERMSMLAEQAEILHRLWTESDVSFAGRHYRLDACPGRHKPLQKPHPALVLAGEAGPRSARIAARWADEYNTFGVSIDGARAARRRLEAAWEREGREPASLVFSLMARCVVGSDRAEAEERTRRSLELTGEDEGALGADRTSVQGTVEEVVEQIRAFEEAGVDRIYLQHFDHADVEMVELIGRAVVPAVA